jgi:hypothetical protein
MIPVKVKLIDKAASGDFPHILFYGPSGAGKKVNFSSHHRPIIVKLIRRRGSCVLYENYTDLVSRR